jgi:RNA polymerase sigma-70 factor (ECF subfamily)
MAPPKQGTTPVAGSVAGELASFEEVAGTLRAPILRYLRRFVGDPALAEDLLQETLVRISKGLHRFEGRSSVKTWAFKIATHTALDHLRQSKREVTLLEVDDLGVLPAPGEEMGERLVIDEMNSCLREEIDRLPESYRAAILLHDLEGLSAAQTAEIVGCSLATAKIRVHRARARLKQALLGTATSTATGSRSSAASARVRPTPPKTDDPARAGPGRARPGAPGSDTGRWAEPPSRPGETLLQEGEMRDANPPR